MRNKTMIRITSVGALLLLLSGCSPGETLIPQIPEGHESLEICPERDISVEELTSIGEPGCNLVGSTVVFPDGFTADVGAVGGITGTDAYHDGETNPPVNYRVANFGIPGIAVSVITYGENPEMWATSDEAMQLLTYNFDGQLRPPFVPTG